MPFDQKVLRGWLRGKLDESPHGTGQRLAKALNVRPDAVSRMAREAGGKDKRDISGAELVRIIRFFRDVPPGFAAAIGGALGAFSGIRIARFDLIERAWNVDLTEIAPVPRSKLIEANAGLASVPDNLVLAAAEKLGIPFSFTRHGLIDELSPEQLRRLLAAAISEPARNGTSDTRSGGPPTSAAPGGRRARSKAKGK